MIYKTGTNDFDRQLVRWIKTKDGTALALFVLSQLISELETDSKGHFCRVELDGEKPIVLPVTD